MADITPIQNCVIQPLCGKNPKDTPALFGNFFSALIGFLLAIGVLWAFINLIQGGLQWISSGGDKSAVEAARNRIMNAVLGLFITFAVWGIYLIILRFLGLSQGGGIINFPKLY
jgi:hypothetical protein